MLTRTGHAESIHDAGLAKKLKWRRKSTAQSSDSHGQGRSGEELEALESHFGFPVKSSCGKTGGGQIHYIKEALRYGQDEYENGNTSNMVSQAQFFHVWPSYFCLPLFLKCISSHEK